MKYDEAGLRALTADSRFSDVGNLPSNFFPYPGTKKLLARPMTVNELRLVSKAAVLRDISHLIRAIDLCVSMDANELTIGDLYYVMMWLRLYSMPKTPYVMEWHCPEVVFRNKITKAFLFNDENFKMPEDEENYEVVPCGTHNTEIIHMTEVNTVCLPDDFEGIPNDGPIEFDFPRAKILQDFQASLLLPESEKLAPAAQWVKAGDTIEDKINILATQDNLDEFDAALELNRTIIHGVGETTVLTCRHCRKRDPHQIHLDALSFFQ